MPSKVEFANEGDANTMRAWVLEKPGDLGQLAIRTVRIPEPGAGQIRVRVIAATTNPVDFKHASFEGISTFPAVFGCDCAGIVDKVGEGVKDFQRGDRVHYFGNVFGEFGSYAEFTVADAFAVAKIPQGMTFAVAATSPCAAWTAYESLFDRMRLRSGETVFIAAGAGGVGHLAIQMAKHVGAKVITTASGDNVQRLRDQGYSVIDYKNQNVEEEVKRLTDGKGVDCAFDMLGEEEALTSQKILRFGGQLTHIALSTPTLPNNGNFFNGLTVHHVFTPGNVVRPDVGPKFVEIGNEANKLLMSGAISVNITKTVGFEGVLDALKEQQTGHVHGKILISIIKDAKNLEDPNFAPTA